MSDNHCKLYPVLLGDSHRTSKSSAPLRDEDKTAFQKKNNTDKKALRSSQFSAGVWYFVTMSLLKRRIPPPLATIALTFILQSAKRKVYQFRHE